MSILSNIEGFLANEEHAIAAEISKLASPVKLAVHNGTAIVDILNKAVSSPIADIAAAVAGTLGETILADLRKYLPQIAVDFDIADKVAGLSDPNEIMQAIVTVLQTKLGVAKNMDLHGLAIIISTNLSGGKLSWSAGAQVVEWYYQNVYSKVATAPAS